MQLEPRDFLDLLAELIEENPLAVRGVLRVLRVEFTGSVSTLAVTLEEQPRLLVNLEFVQRHCHAESHVKALLLHEFLHILLGHTEQFSRLTHIQNLALDAVINAIIHRSVGPSYGQVFDFYYAYEKGLGRLLRQKHGAEQGSERDLRRRERPTEGEVRELEFHRIWSSVRYGKLVADDILELASDLESRGEPGLSPGQLLFGNHDGVGSPLPQTLQEAIASALKEMNGGGIWRSPMDRGLGGALASFERTARDRAIARWKEETRKLLRSCIVPDQFSTLVESRPLCYRMPVLSPRDRRAFLRTQWSPLIPEAEWSTDQRRPLGRANVYLDVSGSMDGEMEHLLPLLWELRSAIRDPFWAFSTEVAPACLKNGRLVSKTTGGTSIACVLRHLAYAKPAAALIVTDGYIEAVPRDLLAKVQTDNIQVLVSRDGSTIELERAGMNYHQLGRLPNDSNV